MQHKQIQVQTRLFEVNCSLKIVAEEEKRRTQKKLAVETGGACLVWDSGGGGGRGGQGSACNNLSPLYKLLMGSWEAACVTYRSLQVKQRAWGATKVEPRLVYKARVLKSNLEDPGSYTV